MTSVVAYEGHAERLRRGRRHIVQVAGRAISATIRIQQPKAKALALASWVSARIAPKCRATRSQIS